VPRPSNSVKTKKISLGLRKSPEKFFCELAPTGPSLDPIRSPESGVDTRSPPASADTTSYFESRVLTRREEHIMEYDRFTLERRCMTLKEWKKYLTPNHITAVAENTRNYNGPLTRMEVFDMIVQYEGGIASGTDIRMLLYEVYGLNLI